MQIHIGISKMIHFKLSTIKKSKIKLVSYLQEVVLMTMSQPSQQQINERIEK